MEIFENTPLWVKAFSSQQHPHHTELIDFLKAEFQDVRTRAKALVGEIAIDLPHYTVHDITHLDALWSVASQIVGEAISINAVEGFILGCSFLLHDAAMSIAAYPGGLAAIKSSKQWKKAAARVGITEEGEVDQHLVMQLFLREQHAQHAADLPFTIWDSPDGPRALIENSDLRSKFGKYIGELSASHWWTYEKLEAEFSTKIKSCPPPFPIEWSIDLLKLACILRTADAAHVDERRAPGFIFALRRNRLPRVSASHWRFQNRIHPTSKAGRCAILFCHPSLRSQ